MRIYLFERWIEINIDQGWNPTQLINPSFKTPKTLLKLKTIKIHWLCMYRARRINLLGHIERSMIEYKKSKRTCNTRTPLIPLSHDHRVAFWCIKRLRTMRRDTPMELGDTTRIWCFSCCRVVLSVSLVKYTIHSDDRCCVSPSFYFSRWYLMPCTERKEKIMCT